MKAYQSNSSVLSLLDLLAATLEEHDMWEATSPDWSALASTEPFCVDTLSLTQWLQFIFIPRMRALLDAGQPLPCNCAIHPYAEAVWEQPEPGQKAVMAVLSRIDARLSQVGRAKSR